VTTNAVNELGFHVGQLRADWRSPDAGPRVVLTDRGATLAVLGSVSDNFFWTERDVPVRNVYTRTAGRHTLKTGGDVLWGDFFIMAFQPTQAGPARQFQFPARVRF
jgi:hypothetical protein